MQKNARLNKTGVFYVPIFRALECVYFPFEIVPALGDNSFKHFDPLLQAFPQFSTPQ